MTTKPVARHYAYARVTDDEYVVIQVQAKKAGLSVSDYVRRAVNNLLLEEGDDVPLLAERRSDRA